MPPRPDPLRLLIILERDVGLFSSVQQVLNTLLLLERHEIYRTPVVILSRGILYFHAEGHEKRKTVWEYYFDPLVSGLSEEWLLARLGDQAFDLLESKRKQLEHTRGAIEFAHDLHTLKPLTPQDNNNLAHLDELTSDLDLAWTESFYPTIDGETLEPSEITGDRLGSLLRRYVQPRSYIKHKVDAFFDEHLKGFYVIGVHVRGTDGFNAPARGFSLAFEQYFAEIEKKFASFGKNTCRVYLATDEQNVISQFENRFTENLVYYQAVRKVDDDEIFGSGPTGQVMPAYIANNPAAANQNGEDAVVEYALLCKSSFLIHNSSSIAQTARLLVPGSILVKKIPSL